METFTCLSQGAWFGEAAYRFLQPFSKCRGKESYIKPIKY